MSFIASIMEDKALQFKVASMPNADKFQLHIYAALAEQERDFISLRTKAALAEKKAAGAALGGLRDKTSQRNIVKKQQADEYALSMWNIIEPMFKSGIPYRQIAKRLNSNGITSRSGNSFYAQTVKNIVIRCLPMHA